MRYWYDTEFQDDGHHIALISIGVVAEDGRELHLANADYDRSRADDWLRTHVLPHLTNVTALSRPQVRECLHDFFTVSGPPTAFWADHGEYDWIALRQLFGTLMQWPSGWPIHGMDVAQWRLQIGAPPFPPQTSTAHDALSDALETRARWAWLAGLAGKTC